MKREVLVLMIASVLSLTSCMNKSSSDKNEDNAPVSVTTEALSNSTETFDYLDNDLIIELNDLIVKNNITQDEDIISFYIPQQEQTEGNYSYTVSIKNIDKATNEYTVVETGLPDDSIEAIKTIIIIENKNNLPVVVSIKKNYRCYRGHKEWSADKCD